MDESPETPLAEAKVRMINEMEHLTEDEFQDIYHKHITNALSDARST